MVLSGMCVLVVEAWAGRASRSLGTLSVAGPLKFYLLEELCWKV